MLYSVLFSIIRSSYDIPVAPYTRIIHVQRKSELQQKILPILIKVMIWVLVLQTDYFIIV